MPQLANLGHIDRALTNISVAYQQGANAFIADKIFPAIPVTKQSDVYYVYSKEDMFRDEVQERGRGAESAGGNFNIKLADPYHCRKYSYHYDITEEERVNYDQPLNADRDAVNWLTEKMLLNREKNFCNKFMSTGVWATDLTGVTGTASANQFIKFSDPTSSPVETINDIMLTMASTTGKKPNFMIMSPDVLYALKNHEEIMDRIKYTQKGIITLDLLAMLFEVDAIYVPWGVINEDTNGTPGPQYDNYGDDISGSDKTRFIYSGKILLGYRAMRPALKEPTAGYIFSWTGLEGASAYGSRINRIKMDLRGIGTERIEAEAAYDMKVICKDMATLLTSVI